ncbi:hypothetical protein [Rubripirellula lacrimiformis]|uniref:hypothetical protein n=1 Tax=Rubripirellula lacrimiformis TaxID=1930273 RepID=UPI001C54C377|nr:hypothetical protein [Rubripirellula lacrimiformis]
MSENKTNGANSSGHDLANLFAAAFGRLVRGVTASGSLVLLQFWMHRRAANGGDGLGA